MKTRFKVAQIELTNHCNMKCPFCPQPTLMTRKKLFMDLDLYYKIIDQVVEDNLADCVSLTGLGEPTLYKKLISAVEYATDKGLSVKVSTNGLLLNVETLLNLYRARLDNLFFSLQIMDEEAYRERLDGKNKQTFKEYLDNLKVIISTHIRNNPQTKLRISIMGNWYLPHKNILGLRYFNLSTDLLRDFIEPIFSLIESESSLKKKSLKLSLDDIKIPRFYENDREYWILDNLSLVLKEANGWANSMDASDDYVLIPAKKGFCVAQKNMFEIFADGTVCLCCLDYDAKTTLGKLTLGGNERLVDILFEGRGKQIKDSFDKGNIILPFCQRCLGKRRHKKKLVHYGNMIRFYPFKVMDVMLKNRSSLMTRIRYSVINKFFKV